MSSLGIFVARILIRGFVMDINAIISTEDLQLDFLPQLLRNLCASWVDL